MIGVTSFCRFWGLGESGCNSLIGAFQYRFWTRKMPRHPRKPKRNKDLIKPYSAALPKIKNCWEAYERFVMMGAISLGLLQIIALKFNNAIWRHFDVYLRTQFRNLPSERTVKGSRKNVKLFLRES